MPDPPAPCLNPGRRGSGALGLHGAFWTQLLLRLLRYAPVSLCLVVAVPVTLVVYVLARSQRKAVVSNLRALHPHKSGVVLWYRGYQVLLQFAFTYLDRLWHLHMKRAIQWTGSGMHWFEEMRKCTSGCLLFTVHSGNYDVAATAFAKHFDRPIHVVRMPERTSNLQCLRAAELRRATEDNPHVRIHYTQADWNLGVELCKVLAAGDAVALQGDRIIGGVPGMIAAHDGITFLLPRGPFVLAQIARVPCYPIFLTRLGVCRYLVTAGPPFWNGTNGRKTADDIVQAWLPVMSTFLTRHWDQWFVFENMLSRKASEPSTANRAHPASHGGWSEQVPRQEQRRSS
jgi:predicted LPLAT superfamily acyltransferase